MPPDERVVAVHLDADVSAGRGRGQLGERRPGLGEVRRGAERLEDRARHRQIARRTRARPGERRQPAEFEMAQPGLMALAEQLEHADALRRDRGTPR